MFWNWRKASNKNILVKILSDSERPKESTDLPMLQALLDKNSKS